MNDVLPKPFTKEGLLIMLEKHLGHLKKIPDGLDGMPQTASTIHPGSHSIKDEASPGSPSTASNWASPNQFSGVSPATTGQFPPQATFPIDQMNHVAHQGNMHYSAPTTPITASRVAGHRRQISEIGPDEVGNDPKRTRMYATTNAAMNQIRRV